MSVADEIVLRRWRRGDIDALVRYANNRKIWLNLRDRFCHPYTRDAAEQWITLCEAEAEPVLQFTIEYEGETIGGIGFERRIDVHRFTAEIGYWIGEPFWGKGIASAALRRATDYGFNQLGLQRIEAGVFEYNAASARVLEKNSYILEARLRRSAFKDGRFLDSLLYARLR